MTTEAARNFSWMVERFVADTAGVDQAIAVSSDGLLMALSSTLSRTDGEQLSAIISGLASLGKGAAQCFGFGAVQQLVVAMEGGLLLTSSISAGSNLGVVATAGCDLGAIAYHMTLFAERAAGVLTPQVIAELQHEVLLT